MRLRNTYDRVKSGVVCIVFLSESHTIIGKGSGFFSNGALITNNHVFSGYLKASKVWLRTYTDSATNLSDGTVLGREEFAAALVSGSLEANYDYAVLRSPKLEAQNKHNFLLRSPKDFSVGDEIALLGFPLDHMNLVCHRGSIASLHRTNGVDVIQIDASVNSANSGGPLIDPSTGDVIGIVTRKDTGLTSVLSQLKAVLSANLKTLQVAQLGATIELNGIDALEAIAASQTQIMHLVAEIERSANVGIGYAFSIKHLLEDNSLFPT